jgi:hypothetical protein
MSQMQNVEASIGKNYFLLFETPDRQLFLKAFPGKDLFFNER